MRYSGTFSARSDTLSLPMASASACIQSMSALEAFKDLQRKAERAQRHAALAYGCCAPTNPKTSKDPPQFPKAN